MSTEPSAPKTGESELARQWIGRTIADTYRIVEVLGEGGMGAVFVAEHLRLRKQFALKTIRVEFTGDGQAAQRFDREARATSKIDHPHVVSAVDSGTLPDGGAYLVIQLVRGKSLARHLESGPLHWRQVAELGAQIADALATCHAAGVIHRDLKPDNILLEPRDDGTFHARIVDFGIARLSEDVAGESDTTEPLTRTGSILGTPGYMAPEQAVGQAIDHRVDLYALGVVLWESCTGQRLWQGDTLTSLFARQLAGAAPSLRETLLGQVPDPLSDLVTLLLSPLADRRPAAAAAVRDDLRRLAFSGDALVAPVTGLDLRASTLGGATAAPRPTFGPSGTLVTAAVAPPSPFDRLRQLAREARDLAIQLARERPRVVAYAAGGLVLALILIFSLCGGEDPKPAPEPERGEKVAARKDRDNPAPKPAAPPKDPPPEDTPAPLPPATDDDLAAVPEAYREHAQTLLTSTNPKSRKRAGEAIAGAKEEDKEGIPEYIRNLAWIEKVRRCEDKLPVLEKITDRRALPGLQALSRTKTSCSSGWFGTKDCLDCLRGELGRMIGRFEAQE